MPARRPGRLRCRAGWCQALAWVVVPSFRTRAARALALALVLVLAVRWLVSWRRSARSVSSWASARSARPRSASVRADEGLAPLQKRRLREHVGRLDEMGRWFCEQRHLDDRPTERPELARMPESLGKVGGTIAGAARTTTIAIAASPSRIRNRKDDDTGEESPAELTPVRL